MEGRERDREKGSRGGENQEEVSSEVFSFSLSPWKRRGRVKRNRPRGPPSLRAAPSTRFPQKRPPQGDSRGASLQARSAKPVSGSSPCAGSPTPAAFLFFHREGGEQAAKAAAAPPAARRFSFLQCRVFFIAPFLRLLTRIIPQKSTILSSSIRKSPAAAATGINETDGEWKALQKTERG